MPTAAERKQLKRQYGDLFDKVSSLLFEDDPIGLNFEDNNDEYDTETSTILPRLRSCKSSEDVNIIVYEEFCRWFDVRTAGPKARYSKAAQEIWKLWESSGLR